MKHAAISLPGIRFALFSLWLSPFLFGAAPLSAAEDRVGLREDCSSTNGWVEWDEAGKDIPPRVAITAKDGLLSIKGNVVPLEGRSSILRKTYGEIDLDKFHYFVVRLKEKGSSSYFGINGFDTKCGYTSGVSVVDLKDYDDKRIHGKQKVRIEIDLHDNSTTLVVQEMLLVSQLSDEERKGLIGRGLTIRPDASRVRAGRAHAPTASHRARPNRHRDVSGQQRCGTQVCIGAARSWPRPFLRRSHCLVRSPALRSRHQLRLDSGRQTQR